VTLPPVDEVAAHVELVLAHPVHEYEVGMTVQSALKVIELPTAGAVLLALRLHETALPGSVGFAVVPLAVSATGCHLSAIAVGALAPAEPIATTPYVSTPVIDEVVEHDSLLLSQPDHT